MASELDKPALRILVTGSTAWSDRDAIIRTLSRYAPGSGVTAGDTDGADRLAIEVGTELGFHVAPMVKTPGDQDRYPGESWKGLNERMIGMGIDLVLAFTPDLGLPDRARGTRHVLALAGERGIPVEIYTQ